MAGLYHGPRNKARAGSYPVFRYTEPMETAFILGREPELSVAELEASAPRWQAEVMSVQTEAAILRHPMPLPDRTIDRLGGSMKQVSIDRHATVSFEQVLHDTCTVDWLLATFPEGRVEFGASLYGGSSKERAMLQRHFLNLKKDVKARDRVARCVTSQEPQLSAVTIHRNGLDKRGKEFVFIKTERDILLGTTTAVQDYQAYGVRDFGRPAADPKSGMLPPKVAQMMLNIAQVKSDDVLLDPFCGSGTVLQESLLLGVREVYGGDSEARAVKDSQENIRWLMKEYSRIEATVEITKRDARQLAMSPTVIVTEPFLGRPLRGRETRQMLLDQAKQLERLYTEAATSWSKKVRTGGRVVMIWPEFISETEAVSLDLSSEFERLGFRAAPLLSETSAQRLAVDRFALAYGRDDARLRRIIRRWDKA